VDGDSEVPPLLLKSVLRKRLGRDGFPSQRAMGTGGCAVLLQKSATPSGAAHDEVAA
jgi:hypothetical protein